MAVRKKVLSGQFRIKCNKIVNYSKNARGQVFEWGTYLPLAACKIVHPLKNFWSVPTVSLNILNCKEVLGLFLHSKMIDQVYVFVLAASR